MFKFLRTIPVIAGLMVATSAATVPSVPAHAVANGSTINWGAAPNIFVSSLYNGVLGRAPESGAVVAGWASGVTSNPSSRMTVFRKFIASAEYRQRYGSNGTRGNYTLGYRIRGNTQQWAVYRGSSSGYTGHTSGLSFQYASALRGYYNTYANRR